MKQISNVSTTNPFFFLALLALKVNGRYAPTRMKNGGILGSPKNWCNMSNTRRSALSSTWVDFWCSLDLAHVLHPQLLEWVLLHRIEIKDGAELSRMLLRLPPSKLHPPGGRHNLVNVESVKILFKLMAVWSKMRSVKLIRTEVLQNRKIINFIECKCTFEIGGISRWWNCLKWK